MTNPLKTLISHWSRQRLPQTNGRIYLPGLQAQVSIRCDEWGIPHIHATNRADLFFAQGFVHAQDRLWQMELNRRGANGELSAVLGQATLDTDRLSRTLGFARLAPPAWAQLDEKVQADLQAYTAGVNAYLESRPPLPVEFSLLRHRPAPWQVLDSVAYGRLQSWALTTGAGGELIQQQLVNRLGPDRAAELAMRYPAENPVTLPQGPEINTLLEGSQSHFFLGKGGLEGAGRGSNGWVIAASRSATGHAILCSDMHLPIGTPSLWYYLHLRSDDGLHVTGFSQPGLPYVLVGHNDHIAWGATLSYIDCEDLFVEQFDPQKPSRYRFGDQWRQAEVVEEVISVRGRPDHVERVTLTHHGPIVSNVLPEDGQALALNSIALRPAAAFDGFARLNEARGWQDFVAAVAKIQAPSLNLIYADVEDNIGYWVSGRVPLRARGDGAVPAPGWTGEYEWAGEVPFEDMPHAFNPEQGYLITANNRIVDDDYPYNLGRLWRSGYRARRLEELIDSRKQVSLEDCRRFQLDVCSIPGRELVACLAELEPADPDAVFSLRLLRQWDHHLDARSSGGAVYEVLLARLAGAVLEPLVDEPFRHRLLGKGPHPYLIPLNEFQGYWAATLLRLLRQSETICLPCGEERRQLIERCLAETTHELRQRLGDDVKEWQWGRLHQVRFDHALGVQRPLDLIFNQGPYPIGGDGDTVAQASIRPDVPYDNNAISVSSRHIVDLGHLDRSLAMYTPGQSGHLGSPHYGDLIEPWLNGGYFPMTWGEEAVTAASRDGVVLTPFLE